MNFSGGFIVLLLVQIGTTSSNNEFLEHLLEDFHALEKQHIHLEKVFDHASLTAVRFYCRIEIGDRIFHTSLGPHFELFHPNLKVQHGREKATINMEEFLEGKVMEEDDSQVLLHITHGVATGSIRVGSEKWFIEPSSRHIYVDHDFHMIAYEASSVKFNITHPTLGNFCGRNDLKKLMIAHAKTPTTDTGEVVYSRKRRATSEKKQCPIALVADYYFYKEIAGEDPVNAVNYMISILQEVNSMFTVQNMDTAGDDYTGYGFQVKNVQVVSTPLTDSADEASYQYYSNGHTPDVYDLLDYFADGNFGDYCLAHLFTNYDFDSGVLGLGYIASSSWAAQGGVCSKSYVNGYGVKTADNVALTTTQNYGRTLLSSEVSFVTGHELGHNWGSSHDSDTSEECAPSGNYYLMYPAAVDGSDTNNKLFSSCSKAAIKTVLDAKSSDCFVEAVSSFCGNKVVEDNEECDPGTGEESNCCTAQCKLKDGAICEDTNSECCSECSYTAKVGTTCLATNSVSENSTYCVNDYKCTSEGKCEQGEDVDDGTTCYDNGSCKEGNCQPFCEYRGLISCQCSTDADSCKQCCKYNSDASCTVYYDTENNFNYLTDGKLCGSGTCVAGACKVEAADVQEKLWQIVENIDVNYVLEWFENNIVLTIIVFTSIFWIPISIFVDWLDDKYDLGYLDDILGGDDVDKSTVAKNQRAVLLTSTKEADTDKNIYPKLGSELSGAATTSV